MVKQRGFSKVAEMKAAATAKAEERKFQQKIAKEVPPLWAFGILILGMILVFAGIAMAVFMVESPFAEVYPIVASLAAGIAGVGCIVYYFKKWGEL